MLQKMLENGLFYLKTRENEVNSINVFPVPDGDTGSNMRMTLENGLNAAEENAHAGKFAKSLAKGMLYGSRGNSGVILSQIFNGLAAAFDDKSILDTRELLEGFTAGYKFAYKAVRNPKEGTMLTVAREGAEALFGRVDRNSDMSLFFSQYIAAMKKSLAETPEIMPILKEAGVVDSGGLGYIVIVEGMKKFLDGEIIENSEVPEGEKVAEKTKIAKKEAFYGYCTEFVLTLNETSTGNFDFDKFSADLENFGNSAAIIRTENDIKAHIHTKTPGKVLDFAQNYGEFLSVKIENMDEQAKEAENTENNAEIAGNTAGAEIICKAPKNKFARIIVCDGAGMEEIYKDFGCEVIIPGGNAMCVSTEEILQAVKKADAEVCTFIANNKNNVLSAEQAKQLADGTRLEIIETNNLLEGYYALAADDPSSESLDYRIAAMRDAAASIETITAFCAERDWHSGEFFVKKGEFAAMEAQKVVVADDEPEELLIKAIEYGATEDSENCIVLCGKSFDSETREKEAEIIEEVQEEFPDLEITFVDGGQALYHAIIGFV